MITIACTRCGRNLTSPRWFQGSAYGSVCYRDVAGRAIERARRKAGFRVRASEKLPREVDPRQVELFEESAA